MQVNELLAASSRLLIDSITTGVHILSDLQEVSSYESSFFFFLAHISNLVTRPGSDISCVQVIGLIV
jgi:hypothetical protein